MPPVTERTNQVWLLEIKLMVAINGIMVPCKGTRAEGVAVKR